MPNSGNQTRLKVSASTSTEVVTAVSNNIQITGLHSLTPQLSITNLVLWFDASDKTTLFTDAAGTMPVTATAQSVTCWKPKYASSNLSTISAVQLGAQAPMYVESEYFSKSVIRCNANGQALATTNFPSVSSKSVFVVYAPLSSTATSNSCIIAQQNYGVNHLGSSNKSWSIGTNSTTLGYCSVSYVAAANSTVYNFPSTTNNDTTNQYFLNTPKIVGYVNDGISGKMYIDSLDVGSYSKGQYGNHINSSLPLTMFGYNTSTQSWLGDLGEILIYSKPLSGQELDLVFKYLNNKWRKRNNDELYATPVSPANSSDPYIANVTMLLQTSSRVNTNNAEYYDWFDQFDLQEGTFIGQGSLSPYTKPSNVTYDPTVYGGSVWFDGTTTCMLTVPYDSVYNFPTNTFVLETWAYFYTTAGIQTIATNCSAVNATAGWKLALSGQKITLQTQGTNQPANLTSTTTLTSNQWYHVAVAGSPGSYNLYINGNVESTYTGSTSFASTNPTPLTIGGIKIGTGTDYINGHLSDFRITNGTTFVPVSSTSPLVPATDNFNTLLLSYTNAGIIDMVAKNDIKTLATNMISRTERKFGSGSISFGGLSDYLVIPASTNNFSLSTFNFTIECWIKRNGVGSSTSSPGNRIFTTASNGLNTAVSICELNGIIGVYSSSNGSSLNVLNNLPGGSLLDGNWHHFALVRNGSIFSTYLDGTLQSSATNSLALYYNNTNCAIGGDTSGRRLNGNIDGFRFTKGIARYTTSPFTIPTEMFPAN